MANFEIFCKFLEGSFSAVSKRNLAIKYSLEKALDEIYKFHVLLVTLIFKVSQFLWCFRQKVVEILRISSHLSEHFQFFVRNAAKYYTDVE